MRPMLVGLCPRHFNVRRRRFVRLPLTHSRIVHVRIAGRLLVDIHTMRVRLIHHRARHLNVGRMPLVRLPRFLLPLLRLDTGRLLLPHIPMPLRLVRHRTVHFHIFCVRDVHVFIITIGRRITSRCVVTGVRISAGKIGLRHVLAEFASRGKRWLLG